MADLLVFSGIRGREGRSTSGAVSPQQGGVPLNKAAEVRNVFLDGVRFGKKRPGSTALSLTFSSGGPFAGHFRALYRGSGGTLYAVDSDGQIGYLGPTATEWIEITVSDAITSPSTANIRFAQMRSGNLIIAYPNSADRLHVWDGTTLRRAGMGTPVAPTVADTGAGAYAATLRYYRARMGYQTSSLTRLMGEAGASVSFTPSGTGTAARVTKPATIEHATHWRVEVSLDNSVWYLLSGWIAVATTTYDDSAATTTYSTNDAAPLAGRYTNWSAVSFLTTDENRLVGANTTGRVFFSPVRGSTDDNFFDEEFVPNTVEQKNWVDLDDDNSTTTALSPPVLGYIWVHRKNAIARLIPTLIDTAPYRVQWLIRETWVGAITQESMVVSVDEFGQPALYWMAQSGPYRWSGAGLQCLADDLYDLLHAPTLSTLDPWSGQCFATPYDAEGQVWWWMDTGDGAVGPTDLALVFHTRLGRVDRPGYVRDGWATVDGDFAKGSCAMAAGTALGATSTLLRPYLGFRTSLGGGKILYLPSAVAVASIPTDDDTTNFQGYVTLPERHYAGMTQAMRVTGASVLGAVGTVTLRLTLTPDYGGMTAITDDVSMAAAGSETRIRKNFEAAQMDDEAGSVTIRLGDSAADDQTWTIDELRVRYESGAELLP